MKRTIAANSRARAKSPRPSPAVRKKLLVLHQFKDKFIAPARTAAGRGVRAPRPSFSTAKPGGQAQELVKKFQEDDGTPFFVLSIQAGGAGLNLTSASHVVHFDRWWNPAVENQATDRAFRIGQKRNVLVHKFVCRAQSR